MQPLLETKLFIRTKTGPGRANGAIATLYSDHIEIKSRRGDVMLNANLGQLKNAKTQNRLIQFTVQNQYYLLVFSSGRTAMFSFMGVLGKILGLATDSTRATAQTWVSIMQQNGIHFQ